MLRILVVGLIFGMLVGLTGCQTVPVQTDQQPEGQWQAKALVRDKRAGNSAVVSLDINAKQNEQKLRMDVTAALGHPVASLVLNGDQLTYVLIENKTYYKGPATASALKPVLTLPMDPKILFNVMFDLAIEDKSWTCTKDSKGYLTECKDLAAELTIKWSERKGRRKLVNLDHSTASVQINVSSYQPKVEARDKLFELNPPKSFKSLR